MAKKNEQDTYITFGHGCSDEKLLEIFKEIPFDMQLISSNEEKISAHYTVLAMFSNYFRDYFNKKPFSPGMEVPVKEIPTDILIHSLSLFYTRKATVPREKEQEFRQAMRLLGVKAFVYERDVDLMEAIADAMSEIPSKPDDHGDAGACKFNVKKEKLVSKSDRECSKSPVGDLENKFGIQFNFYGETPFDDSD